MGAIIHTSLVGRRFSLLLPGSTTGRMLGADASRDMEDLVRMYGFESKLASMRSVPANCLEFAGQNPRLPEAMLEEAQRALEDDGADSIICYGGLDVVNHLKEHLKIPVIDSVQSSTMLAENLIGLRISQSKRAFPKPLELLNK